jgi:nucleoid-associated protein YgaU
MDPKEPFTCTLESVTKRFTMFLEDGIPVRATLDVTFKEYKLKLNEREKTLQSPDKTKVHITQRGDSLWLIASNAYGNAKLWRQIADLNGIKNPRFLEPGIKLIIPPLE